MFVSPGRCDNGRKFGPGPSTFHNCQTRSHNSCLPHGVGDEKGLTFGFILILPVPLPLSFIIISQLFGVLRVCVRACVRTCVRVCVSLCQPRSFRLRFRFRSRPRFTRTSARSTSFFAKDKNLLNPLKGQVGVDRGDLMDESFNVIRALLREHGAQDLHNLLVLTD